jgi:diadenosine tetraphosphate (Ap4A) HIT family hydrolase
VTTGESLPRGLEPLRRGAFLVHPKLEAPPVPGWFVLAPARHVEQIDALTPVELAELGPLCAETSAAIRAETPCARVYVCVFAELLPHFHVHLIARPPDLPEDARGPGVFLAQGTRDADPELVVARRILARLARAWA